MKFVVDLSLRNVFIDFHLSHTLIIFHNALCILRTNQDDYLGTNLVSFTTDFYSLRIDFA